MWAGGVEWGWGWAGGVVEYVIYVVDCHYTNNLSLGI